MGWKYGACAGAAGVVAMAAGASAGISGYDLEGLQHGEIVTTQLPGLTISADNPNRPFDLAIIFNSNLPSTIDPDLEGPNWAMGNLSPSTNLGNLLILAETNVDNNGDGLIDEPNDEGNRPVAGSIFIDFDARQQFFGFDLVDHEPAVENSMIRFFANGLLVGEIHFNDFANPASLFYDPTVAFGNNSANRIAPIDIAQLGGSAFDRVEFRFGGSGAVDNFNLIPSPGAAALAGVAMVLGVGRRRC